MEEIFFLEGFVWDIIRPYKELFVQIYQLKHKYKVSKLFEINNEDTRTMSIASF